MADLPLYAGSRPPASLLANGMLRPDAHAGLWHGRFFDEFDGRWRTDLEQAGKWLGQLAGDRGDAAMLDRVAHRQAALAEKLPGAQRRAFETSWHFVTGLGLPHPAENGFAWHPVLGVPYLCGAAVKGMLRAWVEQWSGWDDTTKQRKIDLWFGKEPQRSDDGERDSGHAGNLLVFDALPTKPVKVIVDVMTPHQGQWYAEGRNIWDATGADETSAAAIPGDWHSPTPIRFLVVEKATFCFTIAARTAEGEAEVDEAMKALGQALDEIGAGAKTAAGYGQFEPDREEESRRQKDEQDARVAAVERERREREARVKAERESMPALERSVYEMVDEASATRAGHGYKVVVDKLAAGTWAGDEARRVAVVVQSLMRAARTWCPNSTKNPDKYKPLRHTLTVVRFLDD